MKKIMFLMFFVNYLTSQDKLETAYNKHLILMTHNSTSRISTEPPENPSITQIKKTLVEYDQYLTDDAKNIINSILKVFATLFSGNLVADQSQTIEQQLAAGVRGFKISLNFNNKKIYVCHTPSKKQLIRIIEMILDRIPLDLRTFEPIIGPVNQMASLLLNNPCLIDSDNTQFANFLKKINKFLNENPQEVVTLDLDTSFLADIDEKEYLRMLENDLVESKVSDQIYFDENIFKADLPWPTLKKMIQDRKRLVIFSDGVDLEKIRIFSKSKIGFGNNSEFVNVKSLENDSNNPKITWGTPSANKVFFLKNFVTPKVSGSENDAKIVNKYEKIDHRFEQYQDQTGLAPSILVVDFFHQPNNDPMRFVNDWNSSLV